MSNPISSWRSNPDFLFNNEHTGKMKLEFLSLNIAQAAAYIAKLRVLVKGQGYELAASRSYR